MSLPDEYLFKSHRIKTELHCSIRFRHLHEPTGPFCSLIHPNGNIICCFYSHSFLKGSWSACASHLGGAWHVSCYLLTAIKMCLQSTQCMKKTSNSMCIDSVILAPAFVSASLSHPAMNSLCCICICH